MPSLPRRVTLVCCAATLLPAATWASEPKAAPAAATKPAPAGKQPANTPNKPKAPAAAQAGSGKAATPNTKPLNAITQQIAKMGISQCLPRINQVTSYFSNSATIGAFAFPPHKDADKHAFSLSMEVINPNAVGYVSTSFSPTADGCDATYDAVTYWNVNCTQTAASAFPNIKPVGVVKQDLMVLDGGPKMRVFLMPAGHGCVAIKKEILN